MRLNRLLILVYLIIMVISVLGCGGNSDVIPPPDTQSAANPNIPKNFIRRFGDHLVTGINNDQIILRGVCFGNNVWSKPFEPVATHHSELDFQKVKDMNCNVIRYYLNYQLFEDNTQPYKYKQSGWDWLDQNIQWAKKYNLYLILNMHVPSRRLSIYWWWFSFMGCPCKSKAVESSMEGNCPSL